MFGLKFQFNFKDSVPETELVPDIESLYFLFFTPKENAVSSRKSR